MRSVEVLCGGLTRVAETVVDTMGKSKDPHVATESCKLKEASNQITRGDAPHSAISKLQRDMRYNIIEPMQTHLMNNRRLKMSLETRRKRITEYSSCKKQWDKVKNLPKTDRKWLQANANLEAAKNVGLVVRVRLAHFRHRLFDHHPGFHRNRPICF